MVCIALTRHVTIFSASDRLRSEISPTTRQNWRLFGNMKLLNTLSIRTFGTHLKILSQYIKLFFNENSFQNFACKMLTILFMPQCVKYTMSTTVWWHAVKLNDNRTGKAIKQNDV